jgi:EAL domain-containing protein (putative c-di-GMP-specific phosphodiesterase class I)
MVDPVQAKKVLTALSAAGIGFSVDDFGTGQASLSYLKELPIQNMKIDKSFVMDYGNSRNAAIVLSTIELGHNLGLTVTAEGVEDDSTFRALQRLGCDQGQGYYFAKPMPPDAFVQWLQTSSWKVCDGLASS